MIFHLYEPPPPLGDVVAHFTYFCGYQPDHQIDRFMPDGNIEMVIDLTEQSKHLYDNTTLAIQQRFRGAWVSGIRKAYITIDAGHDAEMFILGFRRGAAGCVLGLPLHELTDQVVDAEQVMGRAIGELRDALLRAPDAVAKHRVAERHLTRLLRRLPHPAVRYAVDAIAAAPGLLTIGRLASEIGYTQKHLIYLFNKEVGLTPKVFARLLRFQQVIEALEGGHEPSWAQLALDCGYYDQAHFIRDFKQFAGFTPATYLDQKNGILNYVPVG